MKAMIITRSGGPEVLELQEVPDPVPDAGEVLVRIRATALNRADLLQRRGFYPAPPGSPADIPGLEFAGEVESCGEGVKTLRPGDRVMGIAGGGAYAERIAVHEGMCLPVPEGWTWPAAAAVPEAFLTAYDALFERGGLRAGQSVVVHAAASGVGIAAVQLVAASGSTPIAMSRDAGKRARLGKLGTMRTVDPDGDDPAGAILEATGGEGADLVMDLVGEPVWDLNLRVLRPQGRLVLVGLLGGSRVEADLGALMARRLTVVGTVLRPRPLDEKIALTGSFRQEGLPLLQSGEVRPVVDRVMPLEQASEAHAVMERLEHFGKIVLEV